MSTRLDKRAVQLAVNDYGADAERVRRLYVETRRAARQGGSVDLLARLVAERLVTADQADRIRQQLENWGPEEKRPASDVQESMSAPYLGDGETNPQARTRLASATASPGGQLGEYRLLRKLGEGGMGTVYLAYQESQDRRVAIKVLSPQLAANPSLVERFEREASHGFQLNHVNIVRGYEIGRDPATGNHFLVMEYVDGPSAQTLLDRLGRLEVGDAVRIGLDIARALEHAQSRDIVHRDIKPENILITCTGVAKLADLGLAKQLSQSSHLTATRQSFGTPYYMPHEQAIDARNADARSDIFALGATLYHLLTGEVPFKGDDQLQLLEMKEMGAYRPARQVVPAIPADLSRILDKMLARNPHDRYQTASELIVDLERSNLANDVLSFVDRDLALSDPAVRARAAGPGRTTQPDLAARPRPEALAPRNWYLRVQDKSGKVKTLPVLAHYIYKMIEQGRLTERALVADSPKGVFRKLSTYPEFQEALARQSKPTPPADDLPWAPEPPEGQGWTWWILAGVVVGATLTLGLVWLLTQ